MNISVLQTVQTGYETHFPSFSVCTGFISPGLKRPGREVNRLPLTSAEMKNEWSYTTIPPICLRYVACI
jgi:hypothetical protein